ncbi:MAG: prepilin peptidase [Sphingobium sp.]|nr:prepilin peptidase [Sphingobium sp.]
MSPLLGLLIGAGLGAIIGSFLATIVSRWPRGQSVITGRSRCDGCDRPLNALDLVPLAGWLVARGKCRTCGARIDWVHPLMELGCALIGGFCAWAFDPLAALFFAVGGWLLLTLAVLDARHMWLPDALTLPLAALGLTLGDWILPAPFLDRVIGAAAGAVLFALLAFAYRRLRGRDGLGLGDAKLLGAIGAWMGWQALPFVLLIASAAALLWVLVLRASGKQVHALTRIPLGTFLCLSVVPAWVTLTALFA